MESYWYQKIVSTRCRYLVTQDTRLDPTAQRRTDDVLEGI